MTDKNGIEIKTGDIVEITGAFFKNDNGLYFVQEAPGNPTWSGCGYSLKRIGKAGKISTAKYSLCSWPVEVYTSDRMKRHEANAWNEAHAEIEVKGFKAVKDIGEVVAFFRQKADNLSKIVERDKWDFGEDSEVVQKGLTMLDHYKAVAARIEGAGEET